MKEGGGQPQRPSTTQQHNWPCAGTAGRTAQHNHSRPGAAMGAADQLPRAHSTRPTHPRAPPRPPLAAAGTPAAARGCARWRPQACRCTAPHQSPPPWDLPLAHPSAPCPAPGSCTQPPSRQGDGRSRVQSAPTHTGTTASPSVSSRARFLLAGAMPAGRARPHRSGRWAPVQARSPG